MYIRILITITPFLIPWLLLFVEEIIGKGQSVVWDIVLYAAYTAFVASLVMLYILGCASAMRCKNRSEVVHELIIFHVVKLPIFVVGWGIHTIVFLLICLSVNKLEGIQ